MLLDLALRMPGLIVANPAAGTVRAELVAELADRCGRSLPHVEVRWTSGQGDAVEVTRAAATRPPEAGRPGLVFAVGGDGTVREVVEGLVAAQAAEPPTGPVPTLMVVPAGTGNSNYLAHWGDLPWSEAVTAVLAGTEGTGNPPEHRMLDLCRLVETDELVLLGACSGLIAEALTYARHVPLTGRQRYRTAFARAASAYRPYPGRVEVDGVVVHQGGTVLANVGGGRHRGGQYEVLPYSVLDDGLLDVCVIGSETAPSDVPELTRRAAHLVRPGVVYARGRRISISHTGGEPMWFEHDGELLPRIHPTVTLEVVPGALPVLCRAGRPAG